MSNAIPEAPYTVLNKLESNVEIREYPAQIWAIVKGRQQNEAFKILTDYIFGKNEQQTKIGMVVPFITFGSGEGREVALIMPNAYRLRTLPKPYRDDIKLESMAPKKMAVITFSGSVTPDTFDGNLRLLEEILKKHGTIWKEPPYLLQYNEPRTPPFMRRNEAAIQIDH
ncbi:MAG: heme-binding protein [Methanotrichaceae archaeon]|nr:heme-binding protein [Methanotrichaceae archaeon]